MLDLSITVLHQSFNGKSRDGAYSSKLELRSEERDLERESALLNRGLRYILNGIAV